MKTTPERITISPLRRVDLNTDPISQFKAWYSEARDSGMIEADAMTLATATPDGEPLARMVLLRGFDRRGFRFFTNYRSQKGTHLAANPRGALVFHWHPQGRQVRIEGSIAPLDAAESDAYFQSRSRGKQIAAWASDQSQVIESRPTLEQARLAFEQKFAGMDVPRPDHWGGYLLSPTTLEFWQSGVDRLHDRFRYTGLGPGSWQIDRLSP